MAVPTLITKIIDPDNGTGTNYTSLSAWDAGEASDISETTGANESHVAECRCTGGTADTTAVVLSSSWVTEDTVDGPCAIQIWTDPANSYRHNGTYQTGNKYRMEPTSGSAPLYLSNTGGANHLSIIGIQFKNRNASFQYGLWLEGNGAGWYKVEQCIFNGTAIAGGSTNGYGMRLRRFNKTGYISNNIIYGYHNGTKAGFHGIYFDGVGTCYCYNNTVVDCKAYGYYNNNATYPPILKNCIAMDCDDGFGVVSGSWGTGSDYNASDIASDAPGSNSQNGTDVTFVNKASWDLHLAVNDAVAKRLGTNLSADSNYPITKDVDDSTRSTILNGAAWSIGADEVPANTATVGVSAVLSAGATQYTTGVNVSARLVARRTATVGVSARLVSRGTATVGASARLVARGSATVAVDARLVSRGLATVSISATLQGVSEVTVAVDSRLVSRGTAAVAVDSRLVSRGTAAVNVSAALVARNLSAVGVSAHLVSRPTATVAIDARLVSRGTATVAIDARLVSRATATVGVSAYLVSAGVFTVTVGVSARLVSRATATVAIDARLVSRATATVGVSARLVRSATVGVSAHLVSRTSTTFDISAILVRVVEVAIDAHLVARKTKTLSISAGIRTPSILRPKSDLATQEFQLFGATPPYYKTLYQFPDASPTEIDIGNGIKLEVINSPAGKFGKLAGYAIESVPNAEWLGTITGIEFHSYSQGIKNPGDDNEAWFELVLGRTSPTYQTGTIDPSDSFGAIRDRYVTLDRKSSAPNGFFQWSDFDASEAHLNLFGTVALGPPYTGTVNQFHYAVWMKVLRFQDTEPTLYPIGPPPYIYAIEFPISARLVARGAATVAVSAHLVARGEATVAVSAHLVARGAATVAISASLSATNTTTVAISAHLVARGESTVAISAVLVPASASRTTTLAISARLVARNLATVAIDSRIVSRESATFAVSAHLARVVRLEVSATLVSRIETTVSIDAHLVARNLAAVGVSAVLAPAEFGPPIAVELTLAVIESVGFALTVHQELEFGAVQTSVSFTLSIVESVSFTLPIVERINLGDAVYRRVTTVQISAVLVRTAKVQISAVLV